MIRNSILPDADEPRAIWMNNFAAKLPLVADKFGITKDQVTQLQDDAAYFDLLVKYYKQGETFKKSLTGFKNGIRDGLGDGEVLTEIVQPDVVLPKMVPPGIFKRVMELVKKIKASRNCTLADEQNLGIEGGVETVDLASMKPVITAAITVNNTINLGWQKAGMTAIEFQKTDDAGKWQLLGIDTMPDYTDTTPFPEGGKSAKWQYRAIYHKGDERAGQWSDVVTVMVAG